MEIVKEKYVKLTVLEKQKYIKLIKDKFERELAKRLHLTRVSAPLFVTKESGLQDDLNGVERRVGFDILKDGKELEVVQSLAKWKRFALAKYHIPMHKGIYTDMTAIRRDDLMDELHSIYVDQWDWEKVISKEDRTISYLKQVHFITSEELLKMYPDKTPKEREYEIVKKYKTVFIIGIGGTLSDGKPHDLRAPDYDDWTLNGDLIFYHEVLDTPLEVSSMGIRVDKEKLLEQIKITKKKERLEYDFHKGIISETLPLSIGGGIGQSRLCELLLGRAHIGEVQASYWDEETLKACKEKGIELL